MGQEPADWEVRRKVHVGTVTTSGFDYLVRANDRKVLHQVDEMGCKHM